jgi:hypothetical protein
VQDLCAQYLAPEIRLSWSQATGIFDSREA